MMNAIIEGLKAQWVAMFVAILMAALFGFGCAATSAGSYSGELLGGHVKVNATWDVQGSVEVPALEAAIDEFIGPPDPPAPEDG